MGFIPQQDQRLSAGQRATARLGQLAAAYPGRDGPSRAACTRSRHQANGLRLGLVVVLSANSSNFGSIFVILAPFDEAPRVGLSADAIMGKLRRLCAEKVPEAIVTAFGAPPVPGIGVAGGFKIMVEDRVAQGTSTSCSSRPIVSFSD